MNALTSSCANIREWFPSAHQLSKAKKKSSSFIISMVCFVSSPGFLFSPLFTRSASTDTRSQISSSVCRTTRSTCEGLKVGKGLALDTHTSQSVLKVSMSLPHLQQHSNPELNELKCYGMIQEKVFTGLFTGVCFYDV